MIFKGKDDIVKMLFTDGPRTGFEAAVRSGTYCEHVVYSRDGCERFGLTEGYASGIPCVRQKTKQTVFSHR